MTEGVTRAPRRWPSARRALTGAIGLAILAASGLAYELLYPPDGKAPPATVGNRDPASVTPVPPGSQDFSFADISFTDTPAPVADLKFIDGNGRPGALSDFRGRAILLNVWATWCVPCRTEMPTLDRLQAMFDPHDLLVLTLSTDTGDAAVVKSFYAQIGLTSLGVYMDSSGAPLHELGLFGIPATVLINADGEEVGRKLGPAEWDDPQVVAELREHLGLPGAKTGQ